MRLFEEKTQTNPLTLGLKIIIAYKKSQQQACGHTVLTIWLEATVWSNVLYEVGSDTVAMVLAA